MKFHDYIKEEEDLCFRCGDATSVNSLGYCKKCTDELVKQHHEENPKKPKKWAGAYINPAGSAGNTYPDVAGGAI